jgi:hypothetical protein
MVYMSISGNKYAERVFAEHPIAMWSMDDSVYYISLLNDNDRLFSYWNLTGCVADDTPYPLPSSTLPIDSDVYSSITKTNDSAGTITAVSPVIFGLNDVSNKIPTFCVNFWLYQEATFINWFKVGYSYLDDNNQLQEVLSDEIPPPETSSWLNFNHTYALPENWNGSLKLIIKVDFLSTFGAGSNGYVILNGLSVGQESETSCYENLGSNAVISLPDSVGADFSDLSGMVADQYGTSFDNGYYIVNNNFLMAKNDGMPIIYGSDSCTKIYSYDSSSNYPSFIFPGKGMLNDSGRNKVYTLEMWIKVDPKTTSAKKIIGPVSGNNGIYVKEGFITLVVGNEIASHCVGEWYRPMLLHLLIKEDVACLLINGEQVVQVPFNRSTIDLPNDRDWWGVYSYPSIKMFSVDCVSVFPYIVANSVAKRRFVYGQGSPAIQTIDNKFGGTPASIDFSTAEYNSSIIYPDIARWDAGYFDNIEANKNYLSVPNYSLPIINIGDRDIYQWYKDNKSVYELESETNTTPHFISFRPNIEDNGTTWNRISGTDYVSQSYLNFPTLNILKNTVSAVYGVFEIKDDIEDSRTLMSFINVINEQSFDINITGNEIKYYLDGIELENSFQSAEINKPFVVGINFEKATEYYGSDISRFFSSPSSIQLYVGGNSLNTFEGKIYTVGFCNENNYNKISETFNDYGFSKSGTDQEIFDHISSYTLIPEYEYGQLFLDISISSEWEEYYPLTYFASYVKNGQGNMTYDLDMLQVNLGYASPQLNELWKYQQLLDEYSSLTYEDLKESVHINYINYFNLKKNNQSGNVNDIKGSSVETYFTFQKLSDGANAPLSSFPYTKELSDTNSIDADLENTDDMPKKAYQTKFIFTDDVVVYPPKKNNFEDYAIVAHFVINQRSILKNPLKIKSFEISSKNFNYANYLDPEIQKNYVGTKFGTKIYPEINLYGLKDYKNKNPYVISKKTTPYIYTTKKSGVKVLTPSSIQPTGDINQYRITIPINKDKAQVYTVGALNFFLMTNLPGTANQIPFLEIKDKNGITFLALDKTSTETVIKAYSQPDVFFIDGGNAYTDEWTNYWDCEYSPDTYTKTINVTVSSVNESNSVKTYQEVTSPTFYQNGKYVKNPLIKNDEWNVIGISFKDELDFSDFAEGTLSLFGGFTFDNVSYFLADSLGIKRDLILRKWNDVLNKDDAGQVISPPNVWSYWNEDTWEHVYVSGGKTSYLTGPKNIYKAYTATNSYISDDDMGMKMRQEQTSIIIGASWLDYVQKPV